MIIGICTVQLRLQDNHSLKGKRSAIKPLMIRLHKEFNVAAAEVGQHDDWEFAQIGLVTVANERAHVDEILQRAVNWIEDNRFGLQLVDYSIETMP